VNTVSSNSGGAGGVSGRTIVLPLPSTSIPSTPSRERVRADTPSGNGARSCTHKHDAAVANKHARAPRPIARAPGVLGLGASVAAPPVGGRSSGTGGGDLTEIGELHLLHCVHRRVQQSATRCNRAPRVAATERHALQQSATRCNERGLHAAETVRSILRRLETYAAATVSASVRPAAMDALAERTTARRNAGCAQSRWRPGKQRGTDAAAMRHATWQGGARGRARLRCAACESATPRQGTRHAL
jgi:hypothetical protein